ncbi:hypothetical protein KY284_003208 [Solanum tuberosum]|nr:hypothetical protein KY284_003208 [Solanum tuberosum]
METNYYSSVWAQEGAEEMDKKYLSSMTSKEQIDVNKKGRYCLARWDAWGFFIDICESFVWHFICHTKIMLPYYYHCNDWIREVRKCVVFPSTHEYFPYDDQYLCNVSLFFHQEPYCLICGPPYYRKWVKVKLYDDNRLIDAVTFCNGEKICTLFQEGKLGIIHMIPEITKTTCLSPVTTFRAPIDATAMHRRIHLVSWQDQLFLVQQKIGSPSIFEVWEVDFETNQFNRLLNLDGFIIFLSGQFSAATSSCLPQEKNQIYFTEGSDHDTLYAFHIGEQSLLTTKQFRVYRPPNSVPPLFARSGRAKIQHNTSTNTRSDKLKKRPSRINSKRPPVDSNICIHLSRDLQREISRYLISQEAYMNFRLVCKLWRSVAPPLRWKVVVDDHAAPSYHQDSMWLLSLNQNDGLCTFYNPFRNFNGYMSNNDLVGCEIRYAKDGWLLVSKGKSLFLFEPSGKQIIHLPQKTDEYFCDIMSFSASPTNSSGWVIFGIALLNLFEVRISYLRQGDDKWTTITRDSEVPFILSSSSPVYFGEEFCVISQYGGNVGVFGFLKDGTPYWVIHQFSQLYSPPISDACRLFLVQQDQNVLHSVVVTPQHDVHVYELDFGGNVIVKLVKEVKNWLFFTSEASSIAVCGMNVNVDNAVFSPTFNTCNDYTYYSLEDVAFKVLKNNCTDKTQQKALLNRVWIRCELTEN